MKKFKRFCACFVLLVFASLAFVGLSACGKDEGTEEEGGNQTPSTTQTAKVNLNSSTLTNIDSVVNYLTSNVYNSSAFGSKTTYSVSQAKDVKSNFKYYVEVATLSNFSEVTRVKIGNQLFDKDTQTSLSVGNSNFIKDKVWYVDNGKLYVSASVMAFELVINNTITINDTVVTISGIDTAEEINFANVAFQNNTCEVEAVGGKEYNVTVNNGKTWLGFCYENAKATDVVLTKKVVTKDETDYITYGLTSVESVAGYPVAFYPIGWKTSIGDTEYNTWNGTVCNYSVYVVGKGIANAKLNISVNKTV